MIPVQPILVPCLAVNEAPSPLRHLEYEDASCPVTLSADRGPGTPLPAHKLRLTFHQGGRIGSQIADLRFDHRDKLLPSEGHVEIEGLSELFVARTRDGLWDFINTDGPQSQIWDAAQSACGFTRPGGKTPWGEYRVHIHSSFVAYSQIPGLKVSSPFLCAKELRNPGLALDLINLIDPDRHVFLVAWLLDHVPSAHERLATLSKLEGWLNWLSSSQGWPSFGPAIDIAPIAA